MRIPDSVLLILRDSWELDRGPMGGPYTVEAFMAWLDGVLNEDDWQYAPQGNRDWAFLGEYHRQRAVGVKD
jgi:hypothetical protein